MVLEGENENIFGGNTSIPVPDSSISEDNSLKLAYNNPMRLLQTKNGIECEAMIGNACIDITNDSHKWYFELLVIENRGFDIGWQHDEYYGLYNALYDGKSSKINDVIGCTLSLKGHKASFQISINGKPSEYGTKNVANNIMAVLLCNHGSKFILVFDKKKLKYKPSGFDAINIRINTAKQSDNDDEGKFDGVFASIHKHFVHEKKESIQHQGL